MYFKNYKMGNKINIAIRILIISICLVYLISAFPGYKPLPQLTSKADAALLNGIGIHSVPMDRYLIVSFKDANVIYELSSECSGLVLYSMFIIGIFIVPYFSFKHRIIALAFLPILFFGNILRVMFGILVGYQFTTEASQFFHDTFGQILIFFWVLICFIIWLKITKNFPKEKKLEVVI